jgi:PAS domain S-box-containing protein
MPFRPDPFLNKFERLRRFRQKPMLGYVVAIGSVVAASVVRETFSELLTGVRFAPYYIAVAITAVVGGGGPGLLSLVLSLVAANYFMPTNVAPTTPTGAVATSLFLIVAGVMLTMIWLLNHAIDRIWYQAENTRLILESQPTGILGVNSEGRIQLVNSAIEKQLGYAREELFDQPVDQLVPPELRDRHGDLRRDYIEHPEPRRMGAGRDLYALAKDGALVALRAIQPKKPFGAKTPATIDAARCSL